MSQLDAFRTSFKGDIVTPVDSDYEKVISRWAANAVRRARIIALVKDAEDVRTAIAYARSEGLPLAIRGGGHSPAGASSVQDGLVIDLSRYLNYVVVDPERKLATVGGGALWETVDKEAIKHGLATVGGTVNHTGVGGLTLGGGYGWLTAAHGLTIDNLVQATVVTADGEILIANDTENADLFWGLRGGGCNFGVVTEFVFRLHEQRTTVFAGMVMFPPPTIDDVARVTLDWWKKGPSEKESMLQVMTRAPDGQPCIALFVFYNGSAAEGRAVYRVFFDLNPIVDISAEMPYEDLNAFQNPGVPHGQNIFMRGISVSPAQLNPETLKAVFEKIREQPANAEVHVSAIWEYFQGEKRKSVPRDATAFPERGDGMNLQLLAQWDTDAPGRAESARVAMNAITDIISNAESGGGGTGGYANYAGETIAKRGVAAGLFKENYPRLQELKKKYDPDVIFNKWFAITPAA